MALDSSGKHLPGGFGRAINHGRNISGPEQSADEAAKKANESEKKDIGKLESHAREVSIRKEPDGKGGHKYTVHSQAGHHSEHPDHKSALNAAANELGEAQEPAQAQDEIPQENPLGMVPGEGDAGNQ